MPKLLVFQHVPHENLGTLEKHFQELNFQVDYIHSYQTDLAGKKLSDLGSPDAVIVLGGPMSANDEAKLAFIREELRLIQETLQQELPFLGICLGSQMLAKALGAKVYPGEKKEIGWYPLYLNAASRQDTLLEKWPSEGPMFQWHGETFDLPKGAQLLACSTLYPNQAIRYGKNAYGFQFHPEMSEAMIDTWLKEGKEEIAEADLPHGPEQIREASHKNVLHLERLSTLTAKGFASLIKIAEK